MYSSSSDLITIMIRRMFPSWRKDVDVGGGGGALVMVTIMMMGLVILIIMINEKQYPDDVVGDGGSGWEWS